MTNRPKSKLENILSGDEEPPFVEGSAKQGLLGGSAKEKEADDSAKEAPVFGPGSTDGPGRQLEHNRTKEILELEAKLNRDVKEQDHKQEMDKTEKRHARDMNIGAAVFIALLVLMISVLLVIVSFGITIPLLGITGANDKELQKLAISSLGPLAGLSIGFFSGKIKWPG